MSDCNNKPTLKEFIYYDELYSKHQDLKKKYVELFESKFTDLEQIIQSLHLKSKISDEKSEKLVNHLQAEVKRWQGDREFTSKELAAKLNKMEELYKETCRQLEKCEEKVNEQRIRIFQKTEELEKTKQSIDSIKIDLECRHKEELGVLENRFLGQAQQLKKEIQSLKYSIDSLNEEKEMKSKRFRGTIAEQESKWAEEKVQMQQRIREILEEVAHWNKEALKMENRVRQYEKKLLAAGVGLDYDKEEAKRSDEHISQLISEKNKLSEELEKTKTMLKEKEQKRKTQSPKKPKTNVETQSAATQRNDLKAADLNDLQEWKNIEPATPIAPPPPSPAAITARGFGEQSFALITGIKVTQIEPNNYTPKGSSTSADSSEISSAGKENGTETKDDKETVGYLCKAINYSHTKMIEFEIYFDLQHNQATYIPRRIVDNDRSIFEEFSHKLEMKIDKTPLLMSRLLTCVNSEE